MQTSNRLLDDLAKLATGAIGTLGGVREEIETRIRERIERWAADMDLVTREEFDAVREMAAKARDEQARLEARLAALEAQLGAAVTATPDAAQAAAKPRRARKPKTADA